MICKNDNDNNPHNNGNCKSRESQFIPSECHFTTRATSRGIIQVLDLCWGYPLVNVYIAIENHHHG